MLTWGGILYITQVSEKYEHAHRKLKPKVIFCNCGTETAQCGIIAVYNKQHSRLKVGSHFYPNCLIYWTTIRC